MKINQHIHRMDSTKGSYVYYLTTPSGGMLVDTCFPGKGQAILDELGSLGVQAGDIKHILITHSDVDHIGNAAFLQEKSGAIVWASKTEVPYIKGEKPPAGIKNAIAKVMKPKIPIDIQTFAENGQMGDVRVIDTPGHTAGHVSFIFEETLLAGDLLFSDKGKITPSPAMITWDKEALMGSIKKVAPLKFNLVCPAHGEPVERGQQLERLVQFLG